MLGAWLLLAVLSASCDTSPGIEIADNVTATPSTTARPTVPQQQTAGAGATGTPREAPFDEPLATPDPDDLRALETCEQVHDAALSWIVDDLMVQLLAVWGEYFPTTPDPEMGYHDLNFVLNAFGGDPEERYAGLAPSFADRAAALDCEVEGEYAAIATSLGVAGAGLERDRGLAQVVNVPLDELNVALLMRRGLASRVLAGPSLPDDDALLDAFVLEVVDALEQHHTRHGRYPDDASGLMGTPDPAPMLGVPATFPVLVIGSDDRAWCVAVGGPRGTATIAESTGRRENLDMDDPPTVPCPDTFPGIE